MEKVTRKLKNEQGKEEIVKAKINGLKIFQGQLGPWNMREEGDFYP